MIQAVERIRERRTPVAGCVAYRLESGDTGRAAWLNVSRVGAALRLGRYLRPGKRLCLRFASPLPAGGTVELPARVVWCRPVAGGVEFDAGLVVRRDTPEAALAFAALGYAAQRRANVSPQWTVVRQREDGMRFAHAV